MKTTLLIMAAGLGSRYGGNKQIDGIGPNGEILMQYSIYDAIRAGFDKIVFVIKPEHREVIEKFCVGIAGVEIGFAYQDYSSIPRFYKIPAERTKPFGTVHAVLCARELINEPFEVIHADDYCGADALRVIYDELHTLADTEGTMVAYRLKNTVSENGAVTRGVCGVENGFLSSVTETYKITVDRDGIIKDASAGLLDGELPVSMNLWGFLPSVFDGAQRLFDAFLRGMAEGDIKSEYALPTMVDSMIREGSLRVRVLHTDAVWFGVTYREDKPTVAAELAKMHESGVYPPVLFG